MRWWSNDRFNVEITIVGKNAPQSRRSTHSHCAQQSGEILRLKLCLGSCVSVVSGSPQSTRYPGYPSSSSIGSMLHLHFVGTDNWCRATEMGSTAATVKEWGQSGWSETWNDCVVETQALSSSVPLR
jgi:hypothetical protein